MTPAEQIVAGVDVGDGPPSVSRTVLDGLRQRRAEKQAERKPLTLAIPGYDGDLAVQFSRRGFDQMRKIGLRHDKSRDPRRALYMNVDVLLACMERIMGKSGDGYVTLLDDETGLPIRFDGLAHELGIELPANAKARDALLAVFDNEAAVIAMQVQLKDWIENLEGEVDPELLGE